MQRGYERAIRFRDDYFTRVLPRIESEKDSLSNYAAAFWEKQHGSMTFGQRCFRDGGGLRNSVNWPWVDFPPPSVVWKNTGYVTGIFVLQDDPQVFRAAVCNVTEKPRRIGAQLFTLDEGLYDLTIGPDVNEDGATERITRREKVHIERGSLIGIRLDPCINTLVELRRDNASGPVPKWRSRPDLGLDAWDITVSTANPVPGDKVLVTVRVHNIGTSPARDFEVRLLGMSGGKPVVLGKGTDFWSAEARFPFAALGRKKPVNGERWRMNAMRCTTTFRDPKNPTRKAAERSHFSPRGSLGSYHDAGMFGDLYFGTGP